jgi:hypothetical protein
MPILATALLPSSYLSDANVAKRPSLFGDEYLNFDGAARDGNYFSFVLSELEGRTGSKELVRYVHKAH